MPAITGATTTTSLTELVNTEFINDFIAASCDNYRNPSQFFLPIDIKNGASTVSQPRWVSDIGTVPDDGAAVDLEFNATEATDLVADELETLDSTFSVAEYALLRSPSYNVFEDATIITIQDFFKSAATILMSAMNDDACALFASLTASKGRTGVDCAVSDVDDALYDLARRGVLGELVGIFDNVAIEDFQNSLQAATTNIAAYAGAADRMMAVNPDRLQGRNVEGLTLSYKGTDFYRQGLTDTANTGADVVSAIFVRGDIPAQREYACFGQASRRPITVEVDKDISARVVEIVTSVRWGSGIINPAMGCNLKTDA